MPGASSFDEVIPFVPTTPDTVPRVGALCVLSPQNGNGVLLADLDDRPQFREWE